MVLRMRDRIVSRERRIAQRRGRTRDAQRVPHLGIEREIEIGQHHAPFGQFRHHAQQPRHRRRGAGHPGGEHRVRGRAFAPAPRRVIEQAVAALGRINLAEPFEHRLPLALECGEQVRVVLPVPGEVGKQIAHAVGQQIAARNSLDREPVHAARDVARKAQQGRSRGRSIILLFAQHFGEPQPARGRVAGGRDIRPRTDRIEQRT